MASACAMNPPRRQRTRVIVGALPLPETPTVSFYCCKSVPVSLYGLNEVLVEPQRLALGDGDGGVVLDVALPAHATTQDTRNTTRVERLDTQTHTCRACIRRAMHKMDDAMPVW